MKIELNITKCIHCEYLDLMGDGDEFLDEPICKSKNINVKVDSKICDKFEVSKELIQEVKSSLNFKQCDIKILK